MSELLIRGGPILTGDPACPRAAAVLVRDGRVADVYPERSFVMLLGVPTLDLEGRCLLPGFIDAHTHLFHWGLRRVRPDLSHAASLEEAIAITDARHRVQPPGEPLIAEGWDESRWPVHRYPERSDLDRAFPDRPVILRRVCGHMAVANGPALSRIPPGRDVDAASGLLLEEASMSLSRLFPPTESELDEALVAAQASYHALGVTAVHDMTGPDHLKALERARARGALHLDVTSILTRPHLEILARSGLATGWRRGPVRIWGIKLFMDGSLGARTAALNRPYEDEPGTRGLLLIERQELEASVRLAEEHRIPLAIHAIGDRAIDTVVSAFEAVLGNRASTLGHRIEHLEMPGPDIPDRMKALGLRASMQPNFVGTWGQPGGMYEERLGPARLERMNPFRHLVDAGLRPALGSDAMPAGVLNGLAGTLEAPFPSQRLTWAEALQGTTTWAAEAGGDQEGGRLAPGSPADFVVLNREPDSRAGVGELAVARTLVAGRTVFQRLDDTPPNSSHGSG